LYSLYIQYSLDGLSTDLNNDERRII